MKNLEFELKMLTQEKNKLDAERLSTNFEKSMLLTSKILEVERRISDKKNDEFAQVFDFGIKYFNNIEVTSDFFNTVVKLENDISIKFIGTVELYFGGINDEVFESHQLFGKGMDICGSFKVINSNWIKKLQFQNSIHEGYKSENWKNINHYIIRSKEGEFSCIASSWEII